MRAVPLRSSLRRTPCARCLSHTVAPPPTSARWVLAGSVAVGVLVAAPAFLHLREVATRARPPHAAAMQGVWVSSSPDGSWALLKFNSVGMASWEDSAGRSAKGPALFSADALTVEAPLGGWLGGAPLSLAVAAWPEEGPAGRFKLVIDGREFQRERGGG